MISSNKAKAATKWELYGADFPKAMSKMRTWITLSMISTFSNLVAGEPCEFRSSTNISVLMLS